MTKTETRQTPVRMPSAEQAREWLRRWDLQQATYFVDREERFDVMVDVLLECVDRADPLIVDLGVGPGSLAQRILRRIPDAQVVGIDMDPLLLGLAQQAYGSTNFRVVQADLRHHGWLQQLDLPRRPAAFVSTTALHWLDRGPLTDLLRVAADGLAPAGVFIDGDHLFENTDRSGFDEFTTSLAARIADRHGRSDGEGWAEWWDAVAKAPELAALCAAREATDLGHEVTDPPTVHDYVAALLEGGCRDAGQVWQVGDDRVIVGRR